MKEMASSLKRLLTYIKPYKWLFTCSLILSVIWVIASAAMPYMLGLVTSSITNRLLQHQPVDMHEVLRLVILFALVNVVSLVAQYGANASITVVVQNSMYDLRNDIAKKINRLPVSYFDYHKQGDLLSRVTNDVDALSNALQQGFINLLTSILSITAVLVIIFLMNVKLACVIVLMIPLTALLAKALVHYSQPYFKKQQDALGSLQGFVQESMSGFNVIKLYGQEEYMEHKFGQANSKLMHYGFRAALLSSFMMPLTNMVTYGTYLTVGTLGSIYALQGILTVGEVQAFIQYVWQMNQPLSQISQLSGVLQGATAGMKRIFALLDEPEEVVTDELTVPADIKGQVEIKHVDFSYYPDQPLIEELNLNIQPGQTVAIVGPTGAGKTTFVNLLMRFYEVNKGEILIDGIDMRKVKQQKMRQLFGMVLQDAWLFEGTVMENLRFGNLEATDEEIMQVAKDVNIHEYIEALPEGYQTYISSDNQYLSQGQMQLLTIARAVLSNPKILILDEATSSVDTKIEAKIQEAMDYVMENRTSFVIAHRLSTIKEADLILVMEHGKIMEHGTHDELLAQGQIYSQLYHSQFEA